MRTIDADMLLEKVEKIQPWDAYLGKYAQGIRYCMELVSLLIQDAPTIEPEQRWIPVSEKAHPTKEGKYLVTDDAGGMATVDVDDFMYCDDGNGMWLCSQNVTAWMPLPEPYQEEGEK